jgi:hypothetical protein
MADAASSPAPLPPPCCAGWSTFPAIAGQNLSRCRDAWARRRGFGWPRLAVDGPNANRQVRASPSRCDCAVTHSRLRLCRLNTQLGRIKCTNSQHLDLQVYCVEWRQLQLRRLLRLFSTALAWMPKDLRLPQAKGNTSTRGIKLSPKTIRRVVPMQIGTV